ncbi:LacI family DNA-binding transcriptional regulator [Rhodoferax sp.]|uniref:LacI family DNA-binding transcriptional regulator n=1 Tax=Rhodoferax sp. TaxID=50421 RepID=UPI0025E5042F|nr:LacI family DNA-binding transcriptional regulator [Rhodoferax sp.]
MKTSKPGKSSKRATMTDIATQAGVSQSTVSLVLNAMTGTKLSKETRQRVLRIAEELGYQLPEGRKATAADTAPSPSMPPKDARRLILYLVDEISTSPHPVVSVDGAKDEAWNQDTLVAVFATRSNADIESAVLAAMLANPLLAGVVYSTIFTRQTVPPAALSGVPTVLLNCYVPEGTEPHFSSIVPSEVVGGTTATEYLVHAGHKRIGFINGEPWMDAAKERLKGYCRALSSADIAFDETLVREGDWQVTTGFDCTLSLMQNAQPPSAIFCANDLMAVGCLEALHCLGLNVPADVSVIGYDDQEIARHTHPPLTTLVLPNYEMGRLAVELLLDEANGMPHRKRRIKVEAQLVERGTVGPPPTKS